MTDGFVMRLTYIRVKYTCPDCGLHRVECDVPARTYETVIDWTERVMLPVLGADHHKRSPQCHPVSLHDVMIPMTGADKIGGPSLQ